jgi:hypothetical protein
MTSNTNPVGSHFCGTCLKEWRIMWQRNYYKIRKVVYVDKSVEHTIDLRIETIEIVIRNNGVT